MNQEEIRSLLNEALEEEIPSPQVDLWPAVKASLDAGTHLRDHQGEKMQTKRLSRLPRFAAVAAMLVALMAVALMTPQGRALSQSILQFFTQVEETSVPAVPPETLAGEIDPSAPTAAPPSPLISVAEAEAQVGFDLAELPFVPDGFNYLGARLYGDTVSIEYQTDDYDHLSIKQSQQGFYESNWDSVPADVIIPVQIGDLDGEFVQGMYVVYVGESAATWAPDAAILRLRWVQDGVWFEMTKHGDGAAIAYLDQAGLIELAEALVVNP